MPLSPRFESFLAEMAQRLHTANAVGETETALAQALQEMDAHFRGLTEGERSDPQQALLAGMWRVGDERERAAICRTLIKYVAKNDRVRAI